jgi:hypothetical protein
MCCYHNRGSKTGDRGPETGARSPSPVFRLPSLRDDRGMATLEAVMVFALLAGVLLGCMLLGQWGTHLQYSQMGARLLAFNAGTDSVRRFGRQSDQATQAFSRGSWDTYAGTLPVDWLNMMFVLPNDQFSGRVSGTQRGRLPGQGPSLFDFSSASLGYHSGASAATNSWADSGSAVESAFLGIAYYVGRHRVTPEGLDSVPHIPPAIAILETIYTRAGIR